MLPVRDPYLTAIIEEVERNGEALHVSLVLHSGAVITGYLRQSHFFFALTRKETDALPPEPARVRRRRAEAVAPKQANACRSRHGG
jgi:hypothetical protein